MADRIESFVATCGAGTSAGANFVFLQGEIVTIDVVIPKGHAGLTTIIIAYGNFQVIPFTQGDSLSGDDQTFSFDIESTPTGSQWGALMSNADVFSHSWTVVFYINEITTETEPATLPALIIPYAA